jgi:hypothetical protein
MDNEDHTKAFDEFHSKLCDKDTLHKAWVDSRELGQTFWVWALSKYYRECNECGGNFLACLD